ncbi:MAG: hypothetical protein ABW048_10285 [Sphingobium sp.]
MITPSDTPVAAKRRAVIRQRMCGILDYGPAESADRKPFPRDYMGVVRQDLRTISSNSDHDDRAIVHHLGGVHVTAAQTRNERIAVMSIGRIVASRRSRYDGLPAQGSLWSLMEDRPIFGRARRNEVPAAILDASCLSALIWLTILSILH